MSPRLDAADTVRTVLHELRSRVGAIRLAVTTVQGNNVDADLRSSLLQTADRETLRVSTEMIAVTALVTCLTDRSPAESVDIGRALRNAVTLAERVGASAGVKRSTRARVRARTRGFEAALSSLMQLVADVDGATLVSASSKGTSVVVTLSRADGSPVAAGGSLVKSLLAAVDAKQVPSSDGLSFELRGAAE